MSFGVRVIGYRGMVQLPVPLPKQYSADSVFQLVQPPEWSEKLTSNGVTVVSSAAQSPSTDKTQLLRVEVADGQAIRYEIQTPSGTQRVPGDASPILSGHDQFFFQPGWVFAFVDAADYP